MNSRGVNSRHIFLLLLSAALLAFQIAMLQILATSQWDHFASLVISVALLGFGAAGTILSLARSWLLTRSHILLPLLTCACAVTLAGATGFIQSLFGGFDSLLLFANPAESLRLAATALLLMLPFACGALAIGLIFTSETERIGSYYCANMLGSGIGCLLGLGGLATFDPAWLPPAFGLLTLASSLPLMTGQPRTVKLVALVSLLFITICAFVHPQLDLSQYKDLSRALLLPQAEVVAHRPSTDGQVHIVRAPEMRSATGLSLRWGYEVETSQAVFINGDMLGSLPGTGPEHNPYLATTMALPFAMADPSRVLILDAGTGQMVALALARKAEKLVAVEPHRALIEELRRLTAADRSSPYADNRVRWESFSSRTWLARDTSSYDLVIFPEIGSFGGSSGLFALHEQPLLTKEAFRQALRKLSPNGLLSVTSWVDYPVRTPLRLLNTLVELLEAEGLKPADHIAAVRSWGTLTFCIKKTAFNNREVAAARRFAEQWAFDIALLPGFMESERQQYNRLQDDTLFKLLDSGFTAESRHTLYQDYPFRVTPTTDDRPFFSQFLRWSKIDILIEQYGRRTVPFLELGILVAGMAAVILSMLSIVLILLPLTRLKSKPESCCRAIVYFGTLGVGYMWTEMGLIHRFEFYIGQPVYSATLVIAVLLIGSATGSLFTGRLSSNKPGRFAGLVFMLLVIYAILLGLILQSTLHFAMSVRVILSVILLVPLAVLMGMPFPLGLRRLNEINPTITPWAWGINGCLSVVGAAIATLIAVETGYRALLLLAAGAYLLTALCPLCKPGSNKA